MSLRTTTEPTITTTARAELNVSATAKAMLDTRVAEHARLSAEIDEREKRKRRLVRELEDILVREGQGAELLEGVKVNGHSIKMVCGEHDVFDKDGFLAAHGLSPSDWQAFVRKEDSTPYVRVTAPRAKKITTGEQ